MTDDQKFMKAMHISPESLGDDPKELPLAMSEWKKEGRDRLMADIEYQSINRHRRHTTGDLRAANACIRQYAAMVNEQNAKIAEQRQIISQRSAQIADMYLQSAEEEAHMKEQQRSLEYARISNGINAEDARRWKWTAIAGIAVAAIATGLLAWSLFR